MMSYINQPFGAHDGAAAGRVCHYVPIFNLNVLGNNCNRVYLRARLD
jgi:hypothetical protein